MSDTRRNIFDFNHIDTTLFKGTVDMLKNLYAYYQKKHYSYEKLYRRYQQKNLICNISTGKLIVSAAVAGGITLNPESSCHCNFNRDRSHCHSGGNLQEI